MRRWGEKKSNKKKNFFLQYHTLTDEKKALKIDINQHIDGRKITENSIDRSASRIYNIIYNFPKVNNLNYISTLILENICFQESVEANRTHLLLLLEHMWMNKDFHHFKFTHDKKVSKKNCVEENLLIIHRLLQYQFNKFNSKKICSNFIGHVTPLFYPLELSFNVDEEMSLNYEDFEKKFPKEKKDTDINHFSVYLEDCFFSDIDDILTDSIPLHQQDLKKKIFLDILFCALQDRAIICDAFKFFTIFFESAIEQLIDKNIQSAKKINLNLFLNIFLKINMMFNNFTEKNKITLSYNPKDRQIIENFQNAFIDHGWKNLYYIS